MLDAALRPIEVLLVEDNVGDVRLTAEALKEGELTVNLTVRTGRRRSEEILHQGNGHGNAPRPDLILLDLNSPKMDGRHLLREIKKIPS